MARLSKSLCAALVVLALTACTAPNNEQIDADSSVAVETPVPTSTPTPIKTRNPCDVPMDYENCVIESGECHPWEFTNPDDPEQIGGWKLQVAIDGGPREFAMGKAVLDSAGTPVAYLVAPGDVGGVVSERFCQNLAYLNAINGVRRMGAMTLYAGDTLNLDAHTILTVGDENGVVYEQPVPDPMPPQH